MTTTEEIIAAAEALPEEARLKIADSLLESVYSTTEEIDEAWTRIVVQRGHEIDRGEVKLIPVEEVLEDARRLLSSQ